MLAAVRWFAEKKNVRMSSGRHINLYCAMKNGKVPSSKSSRRTQKLLEC